MLGMTVEPQFEVAVGRGAGVCDGGCVHMGTEGEEETMNEER